MRRSVTRGIVWLVALLAAAASGLAAQPQERSLYVSLVDKDGAPVLGAGPDAFLVREDGVRRELLRVRTASDPIQIALLVDTSQAATPAMQDIRKGVEAFVKEMAGPHEIAIITIGERPTIQSDYTSNPKLLEKGIGRLFGTQGSGAYLLDAIVETATGLLKREAARPVIIAIATEGVEFSTRHFDTVLKALRDSGAAFHALVLPPQSNDVGNDETRNRNVVFDRGTTESGGRRTNLLSSMGIADELKEVGTELKAQYLLTYSRPQSLLQPERIEVKAANPVLTARGTPVRVPKRKPGA